MAKETRKKKGRAPRVLEAAPIAAVAKNGRPKMATAIPGAITIPDSITTRLGTLRFVDGFPDDEAVKTLYDNLDFQRGVQAVLTAMPAASLAAMRKGIRSFGPDNQTVLLFESLLDSRSLLLTPNTETVYALSWIDLKGGPVVIESPPNTLGLINDFWFHYVTDAGNAGPDEGKGGKYLLVPPSYKGDVPKEGFQVFHSPTFGNLFITRGFLVDGETKEAVANFKQHLRIYPLAQSADPPATQFFNGSGKSFNTIQALDYTFFEEVNEVVQEEPAGAMDAETLGLLATIGIEKGKAFAPDERMERILLEAAGVGNATARALMYRSRLKDAYLYDNSAWMTPFVGGSYLFERAGVRLLDARTMFFFGATCVTPAMAARIAGQGSQYAVAFTDSKKRPLDGSLDYKLHLPSGIPAKQFWSIVVYDRQTRSELQTDQQFPSISSQKKAVQTSRDGSVDVYFGPKAPAGKESNWVQTWPGKGWFALLRLYGPLQDWFDKTWQPGEIEEVD